MSAPYATPPSSWLAPTVGGYFRQLSTMRKVACLFAAVGMLLTYLAAVFNWYTVTTTSQYKESSWQQEQPVSIGTLLVGDTEEQYTNPYAGSSRHLGERPEFSSYADIYAIFYLVFTLGLIALVVLALMAQGKIQLWLRIGAAGCAALSLFLVVLISADLSAMANAYQEFMTKQGQIGDGAGILYTVEKSVGVGLLLGALASLLLGISAGLNHMTGPAAAVVGGSPPPGYRPPGPGAQPGQVSAPPWGGPGRPAAAPMSGIPMSAAPMSGAPMSAPPVAPMSAPPGGHGGNPVRSGPGGPPYRGGPYQGAPYQGAPQMPPAQPAPAGPAPTPGNPQPPAPQAWTPQQPPAPQHPPVPQQPPVQQQALAPPPGYPPQPPQGQP
ncbi:MAG: hypothetical protein ACRDT6_12575 [Micromonosporaceae bacterium]